MRFGSLELDEMDVENGFKRIVWGTKLCHGEEFRGENADASP